MAPSPQPPSPPALPAPPDLDPRGEMHAAAPFLSWRAIYVIVLGALALQIVLFTVLTAAYR